MTISAIMTRLRSYDTEYWLKFVLNRIWHRICNLNKVIEIYN